MEIRWLSDTKLNRTISITEKDSTELYLGVQYSSSELFFYVKCTLSPAVIYHFDFASPTDEPTILRRIKWKDFDESKYVVEPWSYDSTNLTKVSIFIIKKKDMKNPKPCLISGYGKNPSCVLHVSIAKTFLNEINFIFHY